MDTLQECLMCCDKLIDLINLELKSMNDIMRGDLFDSYVSIVENEVQELRDIRQELQAL
jgi:hypothetical protein